MKRNHRYAMVCSSNQNRSMEAHFLLKKEDFDVASYGTGAHVKLPGPSLIEPNVYDLGTPYKHMYDDLRRKDPELYPILPFFFFLTLFNFEIIAFSFMFLLGFVQEFEKVSSHKVQFLAYID